MALAVRACGSYRVAIEQGDEIYKVCLSNELRVVLAIDKAPDIRLGGQMYWSMDYNIYMR